MATMNLVKKIILTTNHKTISNLAIYFLYTSPLHMTELPLNIHTKYKCPFTAASI